MAKKIDVNVNLLVLQEFDSAEQAYDAAKMKWNELRNKIRAANKAAPDEVLITRVKKELNDFIVSLGLSKRARRDVETAIGLDEFKITNSNDLDDIPDEVKERALEGYTSVPWNVVEIWVEMDKFIRADECQNELKEILSDQDFARLMKYLEHRADPVAAVAASKGKDKFPASEEGKTWIRATINGHEVRFRNYGGAWGLRGLGAVAPQEATGMTTAELVSWAAANLPKPI